MRLITFGVLCSFLFSAGVYAGQNSDVRNISVTGVGDVISTPNLFSFSVHIEEKGQQASELNKTINQKTSNVVNTLIKLGVDKKAIQSLQVRFSPWFEYENKKNVQKGFSLSRQISITLDDLGLYDQAIDSLLRIGITRIDNFTFSDRNEVENYEKALEQSLLNARARATKMAEALGLKIANVISISEQSSGRSAPMEMDSIRLRGVKASSYQPGEMSTQARVHVVFSLID